VLRGELCGPGLEQGRRNDKRGPLALSPLPNGCLYVADLGFFGVQRLSSIAHGEAGQQGVKRSFVSRYQSKTVLQTRGGHRIELAGILPQQVGQVEEVGALLGQAGRLPVRVIMLRVPKEVGDERRARIREVAQAQGRSPDEEVLCLADWTIRLPNVPRRRLSTEQVLVILRLRGPLERLFRLWKEHGSIDQWRESRSPGAS
jgi:Transposase DDE domain